MMKYKKSIKLKKNMNLPLAKLNECCSDVCSEQTVDKLSKMCDFIIDYLSWMFPFEEKS